MSRQTACSLTLVDATATSFSPESPRTLPMLGTHTCASPTILDLAHPLRTQFEM